MREEYQWAIGAREQGLARIDHDEARNDKEEIDASVTQLEGGQRIGEPTEVSKFVADVTGNDGKHSDGAQNLDRDNGVLVSVFGHARTACRASLRHRRLPSSPLLR